MDRHKENRLIKVIVPLETKWLDDTLDQDLIKHSKHDDAQGMTIQ
jgi:hypothetical protein